MGGDHKCPVCQATFTRPQHVARHMRSHTGDRPYKCQHCGDQFARSDLLSRHVNKCHANEKPPTTQGSRRKGSASASRATTSKQACDQCVQSSLPCDGSNPCAKCVQRKCRCTFVKFHRQTAPVGPGHNPRPTIPSNGISNPPSTSLSSRIPVSYPDDFFLGPPPPSSVPTTMAESLYSSQTFAFPPLYPDPSSAAPSTDFTSKYRAQAELFRNSAAPSNAHFTPAGGTGPGIPGSSTLSPPGIYSDPRSASGSSSWVSWSHGQEPSDSYHTVQQESLHDKDMHRGHNSLSHHSHPQQRHHQYVNSHGIPHGLQHLPSGAGTYPHQAPTSAIYLRRGSVEFGDSDGSSSAAEHSSVPSSANSSSVHLPLGNLTLQQAQGQHAHMLSYNTLGDLSNPAGDYAGQDLATGGKIPTGVTNQSGLNGGEPGFSSAFGLMSLDDPNVLAGLAADGTSFFPNMNMDMGGLPSLSGLHAEDPDATPMPLKETSASQVSMTLPMRSASTSALNTNGLGSGTTPREVDVKEMRDFWKQYMRTPLSGPGPATESPSTNASQQHQQQQHQLMSPPGSRRPRVASMPSSKTPTVAVSFQNSHDHSQPDANNDGESGVRTTLQEDLRSYEAAVLARKAPTNLSLAPKMRRGTIPAIGPTAYSGPHNIIQGGSPVVAGKGIGVVPSVKFDLLRQSAATDSRPSSTSTTHSGSPGDSSLAGAFGAHQQRQYLQGSPHLSSFAQRRGSPASSTGDSSSRASSVSVDREGDTDDDAASGESGRVGRLRPAFKRLASQTLGPPNAKRAFLVPSATMGGDVKEQPDLPLHESSVGVDMGGDEYGQGYAPGTLGMH